MWNIATSSAPENSRGSAKKLRANTSRARWRASSGKRSRSSTSAALMPVERGEGGREVDVEQPERGVDVDGGQALEVEARAAGHEGREVPRRGARDVRRTSRARRRRAPAGSRRAGRSRSRVGSVRRSTRAQVVVLPEERVEARGSSRRARRRPARTGHDRTRPPSRRLALEHRDPHAALGQPQGRGRAPRCRRPRRRRAARMPARARHPSRSGARVAGGTRPGGRGPGVQRRAAADHDGADPATVCTRPCCQPGNERCRTSTRPAASSRSQMRSTESKSRTLV